MWDTHDIRLLDIEAGPDISLFPRWEIFVYSAGFEWLTLAIAGYEEIKITKQRIYYRGPLAPISTSVRVVGDTCYRQLDQQCCQPITENARGIQRRRNITAQHLSSPQSDTRTWQD